MPMSFEFTGFEGRRRKQPSSHQTVDSSEEKTAVGSLIELVCKQVVGNGQRQFIIFFNGYEFQRPVSLRLQHDIQCCKKSKMHPHGPTLCASASLESNLIHRLLISLATILCPRYFETILVIDTPKKMAHNSLYAIHMTVYLCTPRRGSYKKVQNRSSTKLSLCYLMFCRE